MVAFRNGTLLFILSFAISWGLLATRTSFGKDARHGFVEHFDTLPLRAIWDANAQDVSRIEIVEEPVRATSGAVRLTVHPKDVAVPGDRLAGKNRTELNIAYGTKPRTDAWRDTWYSWSFLVPVDYYDDYDNPRFQIMGQFHAVPDFERGEDWGNFHSTGGSTPPMISIRYGYDEKGSGFGLFYGLKTGGRHERMIAKRRLVKGKWYDVMMHIAWSRTDEGYVEAWINGEPITPWNGRDHKYYGANMYNDVPPILKLGLYRGPGFTKVNSVYYDEVHIGHSREDVSLRVPPLNGMPQKR